jgi:polar amino acid transport system substrate-binding protein
MIAAEISGSAAEARISEQDRPVLRGGWDRFEPYEFIEDRSGYSYLTGLDVELLRVIAERAGYRIVMDNVPWRQHVEEIETGERDFALAAVRTPERERFAYFSDPYRQETMTLILPRGHASIYPARSDGELVRLLKQRRLRLGVLDGIAYPSAVMREYIADPENARLIRVATHERELLDMLLNGQIDGFLADRIGAATAAWKSGVQSRIDEHPVVVRRDVHLMFSKASVAPGVVDAFSDAIAGVYRDGTFHEINRRYMFPILLAQTIDSRWFFVIDVIGTIAFALSGLLLAYKYHYDIFGAFVLASLPAVGGGITRDLLTNRETLAVLADPVYVLIIVATVVAGYLCLQVASLLRGYWRRRHVATGKTPPTLVHLMPHANALIQGLDAAGLAAFTVTGVVVALGTRSEPLWMWGPILAAVTAAGGGILRDVLRSDPDIPTLKGELYPEIAFVWGGALSLYLIWQTRQIEPQQILFGVVATVIGAFLTRMLAIRFNIRSPRFGLRR